MKELSCRQRRIPVSRSRWQLPVFYSRNQSSLQTVWVSLSSGTHSRDILVACRATLSTGNEYLLRGALSQGKLLKDPPVFITYHEVIANLLDALSQKRWQPLHSRITFQVQQTPLSLSQHFSLTGRSQVERGGGYHCRSGLPTGRVRTELAEAGIVLTWM